MRKFLFYLNKLSFIDFIRKVIFTFIARRENNIFRKFKSFFFFKTTNVIIGKSVRIFGLPSNLYIGKDIRIFDHGVFEFGSDCILSWGNHITFSYGVVFCCNNRIEIGNNVLIGEYTSIRDTTHVHNDNSKSIREITDISKPIFIGEDVWIGRGCIVLPGTIMENGVVVAANSVVKGKLEKNGIYSGNPVRLIKYRF